jgi:hypothetical protein
LAPAGLAACSILPGIQGEVEGHLPRRILELRHRPLVAIDRLQTLVHYVVLIGRTGATE